MKEKEITERLIKEVSCNRCVAWIAPKYKNLSWDIFHAFDVIIFCPEQLKHPEIRFYQSTTLTNISHRQNKIDLLFPEGLPSHSFIAGFDNKKGIFKIVPIEHIALRPQQ